MKQLPPLWRKINQALFVENYRLKGQRVVIRLTGLFNDGVQLKIKDADQLLDEYSRRLLEGDKDPDGMTLEIDFNQQVRLYSSVLGEDILFTVHDGQIKGGRDLDTSGEYTTFDFMVSKNINVVRDEIAHRR